MAKILLDNTGAVAVADKVYSFQGREMRQYSTLTKTWTVIADGPTHRVGHAIASVGSAVFLHGGLEQGDQEASSDQYNNELWTFEASSLTMTQLNQEAGSLHVGLPRHDHAMTTVNGTVFVFGGQNDNGMDVRELLQFSPLSMKWEFVAVKTGDPSPKAVHGHGMVVVGNDIFLLGAYARTSNRGGILVVEAVDSSGGNEFWRYATTTSRWELIDTLAWPRLQHFTMIAAHGNQIYVFGGFNAESGEKESRIVVSSLAILSLYSYLDVSLQIGISVCSGSVHPRRCSGQISTSVLASVASLRVREADTRWWPSTASSSFSAERQPARFRMNSFDSKP